MQSTTGILEARPREGLEGQECGRRKGGLLFKSGERREKLTAWGAYLKTELLQEKARLGNVTRHPQ